VVPWAQSVVPKWTGFSRIAAAVLLPRRLLDDTPVAHARDGYVVFKRVDPVNIWLGESVPVLLTGFLRLPDKKPSIPKRG
jgi:hypothetical protein